MAPDDPQDPTVKDLLAGAAVEDVVDEATRRELEKWFGLPSFAELEERGVEMPEDPELAAARERRAKAIEAIDPTLLDALHARFEGRAATLLRFVPDLEVKVDPNFALLDLAMLDKLMSVADPREVEIPEALTDDLKEVSPQALLRDLHRPEIDFEKTFEIVDFAAQQRLDIVAEVEQAMKTSWRLPPLGRSPYTESSELVAGARRERQRNWTELVGELELPNRRVHE